MTVLSYKSTNEVKCDFGKVIVYKERKRFARKALTTIGGSIAVNE